MQAPPGELEEGGEQVREQVRVAREVRRRGPRLLARDDVTPSRPVEAFDAGALGQLWERSGVRFGLSLGPMRG